MDNDGSQNRDDSKKGVDQGIIDLARWAVSSSVKSLLSTEEGIRNLIGAVLPKDLVKDLLNHIESQFEEFRKDLVKTLGKEMRHYGDNLDVGGEIKKVLEGLELDVHVTMSISSKTKKRKKKS